MSEFDIKIGTQLDTSKALQELMDFVKKYSGKESISIDLGQVKGAGNIKNTTKALQGIQKIAKEIGNTKIDVSKMLGSTTDSVAKGLDKTVGDTAKKLSIAVDRTRRDLVSDATKGIANTTKSLNNEIKDIERSIGRLTGNFNSAKKMQFIDKDSIEKGLSDLNKMGQMKIDISNMNEVKQKISNLGTFLDKTIREANNNAWKENVGSAKINGLLENLKSVQTVMSAKNMDTSGIDDLVDRTGKLMSLPIGELVQQYAQIRKEFSKELVIPLSVKGVINAETAVKSILSYKDDLVKQIAIETDNTKVKQLQEIVQQIDDTVVKLNADLGTVGRSTVKNLIDSSNEKTADNLVKKYDELGNKIEKLNNPKNLTFVKLDDLTNIKKSYEDIGKVVDDVNFNKLDGSKINEVANDISNLKRIVEDTSESAKKLSIKAQIDVGFKNAEQMLLGMESALVKTGKRTGVLNELKKGLQEAMDTFKIDPSKGLSSLNDAIKAIGDQAIKSGLKNITGGLQQYEKYINDYTSLMKKASNTKDLGLAKTYEQEANRTLKALSVLEKGMTQSQIGTANALKFEVQTKASEEFTNSILKTASAVSSYKKELQGINKEVGFDKLLSQAGEKARQEYEGLIDSTNKMQSKLSKMLSSDKVDTGGLAKLNAELKENKSNLDKFKNTSINIKCKEAIADLKELRKEEEKLGHNVSGIDSNIKRIGELQSQLSKGLIGSNQVSKEIDAIEKEHSSMAKLTKKVNDAQKEYKKLVDTVSGLKQNGKLENSVFNSLDKQAESLKGKFTNLNFGTLTAVEVSKITGAVEKFASSVNNAKATDLHLRLKADFDIDASKANVKINGLESALLANGEDTKVVKSLRNKLKKYIETAVDDPALASKGVAGLLDNIANVTASKDLGKITGDLAQYKKYISEIESLSSKASKTTDEALAKKYQSQDKALRGALAKLESGFDEKTLKTATTLRDNAFDGISNNIAKEVDKVKDKINEYKTTMENATKGYDVSKFTSNIGKGLAEQFDQGISKADELEAKLNEMLSSKNVDVSALTKIRNEIENLQKSTSGFKTSVADTFIRESFDNIQIPNLNNMLQAVKDVMSAKNVDTSGIDKLIAKTKDLANVDVSKLSSEFKAIQNELSKEVEIRLGAKGVKTVEDVLNIILKHRNELERQISMEVDSSKVKQLNSELEKTNKVISSLGGKTGSLGGALIGNADVSNVKQLESALGNVEKRYDNLASKANKLQGNKFVDISELRNTLELSESIKKSLNDVKVNPSSSGISKLNSELSKLEQTIKNTEQNAKNIKLNINFNNNLETASNMINGIEASLIKLGKSSGALDEFKSRFESIKQYSKINLSGAISQLDDLIRKMKEFGSKNALGDISGTISQVKQLGKELQNALSGQLKAGTSETASKFEQEASRIESAMKRLTSSMKETQRESANAFNNNGFNNFSSKMDSEASKVDSSINKIKSSLQNLKEVVNFKDLKLDGAKFEMAKIIEQEIDKTIQKAEELKNRLREVMSSDMSASAKTSEITRLKEEMAQLEQQANSLKEKSIIIKCSDSIQQLEQLKSKMQQVGADTSGIDKLSDKFRALAGKLSSGEIGVDKAVSELKKLDSEASRAGSGFEKLQSRIGNVGTKIQGFFGSIKNAFSSFTLGSMISRGIYSAVNEIKTTIMELDSAFANFSRVAPDNFTINTGNLEQVASTAKQIAIDVGQSTADVINAMSSALQAGANTMEQATAIAKSSAIFQNVTDMSAENASKAVATLINQFYSMDTALSQVDSGVGASVEGYNNLTESMDLVNFAGNNFAISSEGVTQALSRGGSVLANYGVTLADSVAMISSANESIQNPERIGNGLKSIAINLGGLKTNAKTGAMELNKTALALKDIAGIDVFTDKSQTSVKGMVQLMEEIKGKWGELTQAQQLALSEAIAGKTQAQVFQSLMKNWSRVREFQEAYNKGWTIGSAQRENEIYMDSLAGKWNTLKENMTKGLTSAGVRDALKGVLDVANNVVLAVEKIGSALGGLGTAGALVGLMSFIKTMSNLDKAMTLGTVFSGIDNVLASIQGASGLSGALSSLTAGFKNLGIGATASKVALGLFKGALVGLAFTAVIAGIKACVDAFDNYVNATEKAVEASKLKQDGIRDELQTLSSQKSGLQEIAKEYDTLSSKSKLTYQEASRFKELKQQIAQIAPDLVSGYDASGDPILKLNGSLTKYISTLDKAIAKQEKLYQAETRKQANEYLKQNDKNGGSVDDKKYRTELDYALQNAKTRYDQARKLESDYTSNSVKWAKQRIKARDEEAKANQKELEEISRVRALASEKDQQIQQAYIDDFQKRSKIAKEEYKNQFTNFMGELDWSQLGTNQANQLSTGLQKLSEKTAFTMQQLSSKAREATRQANEAFKDTGAINTYGKALQKIAEDSGKFDIQSWSGYLDEVNARFEAGAMTTEQYSYSLGIMADTMSSMTGVPASVFETALKGTGDLEVAFQNATTGLNNFLSAYGKSTMDLEMGDSIAESLTQQFEDLLQFGNDFDLTLEKEGKIECSWLVQQKDSLDLPKQMEDMIDLVVADGEVTEVEQKVLMGVQTEIKNEGQLKDETVKTIEGLLDGTLEIDKGIEIAGIKLNAQEAEQLKQSLQEAGISAKDLKLGDTGIEKAEQQAQALEQELSKISDTEIRLAIEEQGFDSAEKVQNLVSVLETVPEEKKTQFIADTGEYFNNANSVEEAIKSMPDELKIKYNVGVEGDERLESLKSTFDSLPESIQTKIGVENGEYTVDQIQMIKDLVTQFGETDANAFLSIEGAPEALAECTTVEEFLQRLQEMVVEGKVTITAETEEAENAEETLNELDGEEATATVNTELNEGAYNKLQEALDKIHGEDGKQTQSTYTIETDTKELDEATKKLDEADGKQSESNYKTNADTKELDEATQKLDEANGKQSESNYKANADTKELDEATKKLDETDGKQTQSNYKANADTSELKEAEKEINNLTVDKNGTVTVTVSGKEQIQATINDKKQLEVNGQAVTNVQIAGGEQYSVAINKKGQLEVNGVAQTQIDVSGSDQLVLAKNEKGQLEVNGQAVTDIQVNGKEEVSQAKQEVDNLTKEGNKNVSINIDVSLKDTVGEIMSRLGFNKKTEEVQIKVTCDDQATPVLQKVTGYQNKSISVTINAKDNATPILNKISNTNSKVINVTVNCVDNASAKVDKIKSMPSAKQITVTISCQNGGNVLNIINQIASKTIPSKTFSVTCNGQSALGVLNNLASKVIPSKTFSINCNDNATSKVSSVIGRTIPNKTFTVTCKDNASAVLNKVIGKKVPNKSFTVTCRDNASGKLSSIISKLSNIRSKSISVTTTYRQVGKPPKTQSAGSPEIIKLAKPSFGSGTTQTLSGTTQALGGEIQAINNNAETLNNAVSTANNSAELMASKKIKPNIDTSKTIDAVKYNVDLLNNMSNLLSKLATQIDTLKAKQQRTWGSATTKLLKEQISLLTKQQSLTKVNIKNIEGMSKKLKSSLKKQGFKFKDDGSISNYNSKLIAMEKNVEKLKKKEESYKGKSEKTKDKLSKAYEKANDQLQKTKNKLSEYYDLQFSELPNAKKQWEEYANAIAEAKAEIIKADREAKTFFEDVREGILNSRIDRDTTKADTAMTRSDLAKSWKESVKWINEANRLLEKNLENQEKIKANAEARAKDNKGILSKNGFKFFDDGMLEAPDKTLDKLRKKLPTAEYEAVKEAYDAYVEDMYNTIPKAENEWYKLREEIERNKEEIVETNKAMQELVDNADLTQLTASYERLNDELSLSEAKMERVHGQNKLSYIQEQMDLLEQMSAEQEKIAKKNKTNAGKAKLQLVEFGVGFNENGDIKNLENVLNGIKKNGTLDDMEKFNELVENYNSYMKDMRDANLSVEENKNKIEDLKDSIIELNKELEDLQNDAWATEFENDIKVIQNRLDNLDAQLELSNDNQMDLLNEKIKAYQKLAIATESSLLYKRDRAMELGKKLSLEYGFKVNDDGTIDDIAEKLTELRDTLTDTEFDVVNDYLQEYFDVALDEIPELERQLLEYQKNLKDVQREKLETTKKIEDEITKIYEKQIDERIDKINEEKDAQVKALNEAKDAYNRYRDEVDYRDDYNKQLKTVEDLQKKIEIAKRDDSLAGQKRLADLMNQLQEEQENLEKLVQDKIDEDINQMFDDQIDKVENDAEDEIKNIEDTWTESKIAEMVEQALNTGIFTDIDGNIKSLDTALLEFANNSSEYFGVMGASLKKELIDNLKVAYSTMDEIKKIYNDLNVSDFSNVNSLPNVNIQGSVSGTPINNNNITIGDTNITVEGSADSQTVEEIELMLKDYQQKIYTDIMKNVK